MHIPQKSRFTVFFLLIIPGLLEINIEDINDNAPEFIYSNSVFGECISEIITFI